MPSFNAVNYSLRPSKSIQRQLIFESIRMLQSEIALSDLVYVGLGSIWFTDFVLAHKILFIDEMISIEAHPVGYQRAQFNRPYATVTVREGSSTEVLPTLFSEDRLVNRPWVIWMDYDFALDESVVDDIRMIVEHAPPNSVLLVTVNAYEMKYGQAIARHDRLKDLLGGVVPDRMPVKALKDSRLQQSLMDLTLDFMQSVAASMARPGGLLPAFRVAYSDNSPMITVGGVLPRLQDATTAGSLIASSRWLGNPPTPIIAPHLTIKEAATLQATLPRAGVLSREMVQSLGFDLEEEQIEAFVRYYRQYPAYAQIIA